MPSPRPTLSILLLTLACGFLSACIWGYPIDSAFPTDVSWQTPTYDGYTVGQRYAAKQRLAVWRVGDAFYLTAPDFAGNEHYTHVGGVPAGTVVSITAIRRWNTITHGYEFFVETRANTPEFKSRKLKIDGSLVGKNDGSLLVLLGS